MSLRAPLVIVLSWLALAAGLLGCDVTASHATKSGWPYSCGCQLAVSEPGAAAAAPAPVALAPPAAPAIPTAKLPSQPTRPPNIVLLIGDDHGWPYFGFMGSKDVLTPNLDALAARGTLFTRGHSASSVCLPTLSTMLTGLTPYQYEVSGGFHRKTPMTPAVEMELTRKLLTSDPELLPRLLAARGYASFEGGKFWTVTHDQAGFTSGMTAQNTDNSKLHPVLVLAGAEGLALGRTTNQPVYDFIDQNADRPFFLWYAPMLPHSPMDPPEKYLRQYDNRPDLSPSAKKYYANCTRFDEAAGELLNYLRDKNLLDNTIILYFNDNGWEQPPTTDFTGNPLGTALAGDHGKLSMHEFGFRTPILLSGPGILPGKRHTGLVSQTDLYATILDYASALPQNRGDGHSLRPTAEGRENFSRPEIIGSMIQVRVSPERPAKTDNPWGNPELAFYRTTDRWHFILYESRGTHALYDKSTDPDELNDVSAQHPDIVAESKSAIEKWKQNFQSNPVKIPGL